MLRLLWAIFFRPEVVGPLLWIGVLYLMMGGSAVLLGLTIILVFVFLVVMLQGPETSQSDGTEYERPSRRGF